MMKSIAILMLCALFSCFSNVAFADSSSATLQPVKQNVQHGKRHHAHKTTKHKGPRRQHHTV